MPIGRSRQINVITPTPTCTGLWQVSISRIDDSGSRMLRSFNATLAFRSYIFPGTDLPALSAAPLRERRCGTSRPCRPKPLPASSGGACWSASACRVRSLGPGIERSRNGKSMFRNQIPLAGLRDREEAAGERKEIGSL